MVEIELKFQIPAGSLPAVRDELAQAGCRLQPLRAAYLDTPQRHLARARAALRLRREGEGWVQTVKAQGAGVMRRLEHNAPAGAGQVLPALDLARHAGTPAEAALQAALGDVASDLAVVFETDVGRTLAELAGPGGALIEVALDEGEIRAAGHRLPLCELELELRTGEPAALPVLAADWVARHGLWLDTRSKAERGEGLARGPRTVAALRPVARPPADLPPREATAALLSAVLANGSVLADAALDGAERGGHLRHWQRGLAELLHQLGVADAPAAEPHPRPDPDWAGELVALLAPLDAQPAEAAAGRIARGARYNRLMLALLGWSQPL